jgi:uncharacterized tellurite resistance protein B-like protein
MGILMAATVEVAFLQVLACAAWADERVSNAEINFLKRFVREFNLGGDEWAQVEMYLDEPVDAAERKRVTRRFLSRVHRAKERRRLLDAVAEMLHSDEEVAGKEREWLEELRDLVSGARRSAFLLDGLKSLLRGGRIASGAAQPGREADLHDFIHNRVLFKLRRRLPTGRLEKEGSPEKLKKLCLSAALLGRVGYVDSEFLPQEQAFLKKVLKDSWHVSAVTADAVAQIALEVGGQGIDLHRLLQEAKATLSGEDRHRTLDALFALAHAEGKMSSEEIEEIRTVAHGLGFSQRQFINAKLKVLGH